MKTNRQHNAKGRQVLTKTRNSDKPFVPPRLVVPESQTREDDSEEETQLPKDQPPYIPPAKDFVPVEDIFLEERHSTDEDERKSEDEDEVPIAVMLQRQIETRNTNTATSTTSSDEEDNIPVSILLDKPKKNLRDANGEIVVGEAAIGVGIAKIFQDLGMFTGIVDRIRKEGRETLYHVLYTDGDEEELSHYEYVLACQLYEGRHTFDEMEANSEMEMQPTFEGEDSGSEYSDTNDRKLRKAERNEMLRKRRQKRKKTKEGTPKTMTKKSKVARLRELTTLENGDVELLGGKKTLTTKTWDGLNAEQRSSTLHELEKPLKTKMKKTLQDELLKVHCPHIVFC